MINPGQIQQKALKLWDSGRILQDSLATLEEDKALFPWHIKFHKPNAQRQLDDFGQIRDWINTLKKHSNESGSVSYGIEYKTSNHRQLGAQQLPAQIVFHHRDDLLSTIGKRREFKSLLKTYHQSIARYPALGDWILRKPRYFMKHQTSWRELLSVCDYLVAQPRPECYIRELEITTVDSKFIENNKAILTELLDLLLPLSSIDQNITGLTQHGFERRFGLKYDEPIIRLRLLDKSLQPAPALSDLSLPVSQLNQWNINCWRVFITENKVNGLSFPSVQDSLVIFGLGYSVDSLAKLKWLEKCEIYYWGDIDTHGFSILSRLRAYFPSVHALMMDETTLSNYQPFCVEEPVKARCRNQLQYLTEQEQQLYQTLQITHQRLEQERIPMAYVKKRIRCC